MAAGGNFTSEGFALMPRLLTAQDREALRPHVEMLAGRGTAGSRRLLDLEWCKALARSLKERLQPLRGVGHVAVQCTYFEKSKAQNWLVPIHQDLGIPLDHQCEAPGFERWSRKEGEWFAQAPAALLAQLIAVRVHLDPCSQADGPLQVVPGSHVHGILSPDAALEMKRVHGALPCVADSGDALLMRPLLLHASSKATGTSRRRVLHFLFGPRELPHGLRWLHAV